MTQKVISLQAGKCKFDFEKEIFKGVKGRRIWFYFIIKSLRHT